jgi:hypothetical protein
MKEVQKVVGNLIMENQIQNQRLSSVELVIDDYIDWKKDTNKFKKFMEKKYERKEESKSEDGAGPHISDK